MQRIKRITAVLIVIALLLGALCLSSCSAESSLIGSWKFTGDSSSNIRKIVFETNHSGKLYDTDGSYPFEFKIEGTNIVFTISYGSDDVVKKGGTYSLSNQYLDIEWMDGSIWSFDKMGLFDNDDKQDNKDNSKENKKPNISDIVGTWYGYAVIDGFSDGMQTLHMTLLSNGTGSITDRGSGFEVTYSCTNGNAELSIRFISTINAYIGTCSIAEDKDGQTLTFHWDNGQKWIFYKDY